MADRTESGCRRGRLCVFVLLVLACSDAPTEPGTRLVFDNQSGLVVTAARYAACGTTNGYGPNRLNSDLPHGRSVSFDVAPDCWDLQVTYAGGAKRERYAVVVNTGETRVWTIPPYP